MNLAAIRNYTYQFFVALKYSLLFLTSTPLFATSIDLGGGNRVNVSVKSMKAFRDQNMVKQAFDYSCGAASLATLLNYGVGDKTTEKEILLQLMQSLPKDQEMLKKKEGFSLLDLKNVATMRGHKSNGFRLEAQYLSKLGGPVIVFIRPQDYEHFAVLKGVRGDRIYLADPSLGNVRMPAYKFLRMWLGQDNKGIIFIVERKDGKWPVDHPLTIKIKGVARPEILTTREMLEIGNPYIMFPHLLR